MRIIHFCDTMAVGGGIASFIQNLASEQSKFNEISLGVIGRDPNANTINLPDNIKIVEFNKSKPGFSVVYPFKIFLHLLLNDYEVVHIHSSFLYYFLSILLLHKRCRFVYTVHSDAVKENSSKWDKKFWKIKKLSFKRRWILPVTISPASKISFDNLYGMSSPMVVNGIKKERIFGDFIELNKYRITNQTKLFIHVGRITEAKNQIMLCQAVSELIAEGYDISLVIVGVKQDTNIFSDLQSFLSRRIVYIGERTNIKELLCEADAMCLSSIWEGMPIILLESLSVGCIPICTPVGGVIDVVRDGYNGVLSTSTSLTDYKLALIKFLKMDMSDLNEMQKRVLESFVPYDIRLTSEKYMNLYTLER